MFAWGKYCNIGEGVNGKITGLGFSIAERVPLHPPNVVLVTF